MPLALATLTTAWKPRIGLLLAALAPLAMFWRVLSRPPLVEGLGWWALSALAIGAVGWGLERASGRSSAWLLLGSSLVTGLGLALSGSVVLAQIAGLLALSSLALVWRSTPSARWAFAVLQGLLVFAGLHLASLGALTPLLALAPLTALLARFRFGALLGGLVQVLIAGAFLGLWLQEPYF